MSDTTESRPMSWNRWQIYSLAAAGLGVLLCIVAALVDWSGFLRSYVFAFCTFLAFPLGAMAILMLHQLTGGKWGAALQPALKSALATLPVLVVLLIPLLIGITTLYPWANTTILDGDALLKELVHKKVAYLNVPFFLIRTAVYVVVWLAMMALFLRWSSKPSEESPDGLNSKTQTLSGPGLVLFGLTVTFAAFDWIMSLEPEWFSSIFGVLIAASQCLPAFALGIVVLSLRQTSNTSKDSPTIKANTWNDMGGLMLMFVLLWTYMSFSQFFLIWSGNLPEEVIYYTRRNNGLWLVISWLLGIFNFAVPFFLLMSGDIKRNPARLIWVAGGILVIHVLHTYWLIKPAFIRDKDSSYIGVDVWDPFTFLAVGGLMIAAFLHFWNKWGHEYPVEQESVSHDGNHSESAIKPKPAS